jgi:DNA-binding response OmpR family regulator
MAETTEPVVRRPHKVLLVEDDDQFEQMLKDFLESHSFDVVAVRNGAEGVREVMSSDFSVIVCDMMMPKLPGDMFYRAVQSAKPHLCDRFVFITGHRGDAKINEFLKKIDGTMLPKPFHVDDLIETINFVQFKSLMKAA